MNEKKTDKNLNNNGAAVGVGANFSNSDATSAASGSIVLKLEEDVKSYIFNVMYILLKDSDISFWKYSILLFVEFLQMLQYTFDPCVSDYPFYGYLL